MNNVLAVDTANSTHKLKGLRVIGHID